jgi:hypothetical protein
LGIITNALVMPLMGLFIALNHSSPRFVLPAIAIDLYFIANLVMHAKQAHLLAGLDYTGPVTKIQRRIDQLVRLRIRFAQWLAMTMVLIWVPVSIVVAKAFLGLDLYALSPIWLLANAAAGLSCIPIVLWLASRVALGKMVRPSQWFLREVAGENIGAVKNFLDHLSDLGQERSHAS